MEWNIREEQLMREPDGEEYSLKWIIGNIRFQRTIDGEE